MSRRIEFFAAGFPQAQGSVRAMLPKGARYPVVVHDRSKELATWRATIALRAAEAKARAGFEGLMDGPVTVEMRFTLKRPNSARTVETPKQRWQYLYPWRRPDLDKLQRAVLDSLSGVLLGDDAQVVKLTAVKMYGDPGVVVAAELLMEKPT